MNPLKVMNLKLTQIDPLAEKNLFGLDLLTKTMEYLSSGVPVVAYKLDGIPDEYDSYLNYVPNNSAEALADTIERICATDDKERKAMGERARKFVAEEKNK